MDLLPPSLCMYASRWRPSIIPSLSELPALPPFAAVQLGHLESLYQVLLTSSLVHLGISTNERRESAVDPSSLTITCPYPQIVIRSGWSSALSWLWKRPKARRTSPVMRYLTFVPDQPSLKAASCASSSPNPSINPLTNGRSRLIAAPLSSPHIVGGEYRISGELEDDGGDGESSLFAE